MATFLDRLPQITSVGMQIAILVFGLMVLRLQTQFLTHTHNKRDHALQYYATTLVVLAVMFIFAAGAAPEFMSALFGLLGTIIGYVLGQESGRRGQANLEAEAQEAAAAAATTAQPPPAGR